MIADLNSFSYEAKGSDISAGLSPQQQHSQAQLGLVVDDLRDVLFQTDAQGHWIFLNQAWSEITGFSIAQSLGKSFFEFVHPKEKSLHTEFFWDLMQQKREFLRQEIRFLECEGGFRWLEMYARVNCNSQGTVLGASGVLHDITEQKRAQLALRNSEERFRLIEEGVRDYAIIMLDPDGHVMSWNAGAERIQGYTAKEIMGRHFARLFPAADISSGRPEKILREAAALGRCEEEEWRVRKDGSLFWSNSVVTALHDETGYLRGFANVTCDITERKRLEKASQEAKEWAEKANAAKSEFLAHMSHELRTPLNSILGFANILRKNKVGHLAENEVQYLERIFDNGKHLLSLINDILDLSKIEAGKPDMQWTSISLAELLHEIIPHFEGQTHNTEVTVICELPMMMAPMDTDAGKLKQVLINLIGNALKFTAKGWVKVSVTVDPNTQKPKSIAVSDTGIGIPPDRQKVVFEAFQQADTTTSRKYGGTGLGLSISKSILDLMGYNMELISVPGVGTTFIIHFAELSVMT